MDLHIVLVLLACSISNALGWTIPYHPAPPGPHRPPIRLTRFAPPPPPGFRLLPVRVAEPINDDRWQRAKRNHDDEYGGDSDYNRDSDYNKDDSYAHRDDKGVTGPVHTFVKTDKNANYKWGVRHHVGNKYAS